MKQEKIANIKSNQRGEDHSEEDLKREKLEAEVELLKLQADAERGKLDRESRARPRIDWKIWVPIIVSMLTLLGSTIPIAIQLAQYLSQQEKEYEFKLSQEIIQLIQNLSDPGKQSQRGTYIYLLSAFEEDAIPVLLDQLHHARSEDLGAILRALEAIQKKESVQGTVTRALLDEAERVFGRYHSDLRGAANFVVALGQLSGADKPRAQKLLIALRRQIQAETGDQQALGILGPKIGQACKNLIGTDCLQES